MRVIWEPSDIRVGRIYGKDGCMEQWLIGYRPDIAAGEGAIVSISLSDGMVTEPKNKMEVAEMLSLGNYMPAEYLATHQPTSPPAHQGARMNCIEQFTNNPLALAAMMFWLLIGALMWFGYRLDRQWHERLNANPTKANP